MSLSVTYQGTIRLKFVDKFQFGLKSMRNTLHKDLHSSPKTVTDYARGGNDCIADRTVNKLTACRGSMQERMKPSDVEVKFN